MIRFFDILLSALGLLLGWPVLAVIALIGLWDTGSPLFRQQRVGRFQQPFMLVKFRTMRPGTASVATHLASASAITPFGRFLRRTKLDELPQLWNVLKGEMSLVGPRPIVQDELPRYGSDAAAYLRVRPGLTGLWQTTGRNDVSYDERVGMDVAYERNISFTEDLRIMVMTIVTMLRRTGK